MSRVRNTFRELRLPPVAALAVVGVLLVCSQIAEVAHAEIDCEHESCGLCIVSAGDDTLVGNAAPPLAPSCKRRVESSVSANTCPPCPTRTQFIRGPPTT